ncbi:hypothetical protein Tco_1035730 [Tanacetum coccineum]
MPPCSPTNPHPMVVVGMVCWGSWWDANEDGVQWLAVVAMVGCGGGWGWWFVTEVGGDGWVNGSGGDGWVHY